MLGLICLPVLAVEEPVVDIELLEFLGTIAGLESMGVDIDLLLSGMETNGDELMNDGENDEEIHALHGVSGDDRNDWFRAG
jgi:hypothetical protein